MTDPRRQPERRDLSSYPFHHEVRARFADVDSFGHLNNVAIASFHEDARAAFNHIRFGGATLSRSGEFHFVIAQVTIRYLAEALYPGTYQIGLGISRIGNSSLVYSSGLFRDGHCLGLCDAVMVHMTRDGAVALSPERRTIAEEALITATASA